MEQLEQGLMTVNDVARFLAISRPTLYGLLRRKELPYLFVGSDRRIPRAAVMAYCDRQLSMREGGDE